MAASAREFASLPELVRCLAEQIPSPRLLARLCLVNKTFNAAVTPVLYQDLKIAGNRSAVRAAMARSRHHHRLVKRLSVTTCSGLPQDRLYDIALMLFAMPRLESFTWSGLPLGATTVRRLYESCPSITAIHITFPDDMGRQMGYTRWNRRPNAQRQMERAMYGKPDFAVFSGLEELTLDNLFEEVPWWRSQIVQVLKNSPGLQRLRLSFATSTLFRGAGAAGWRPFYHFFDELCAEYGKVASPLRLQSLHLGTAVLPFKFGVVRRLTDLSALRNLHVENRALHNMGIGTGDLTNTLYFDPDDHGYYGGLNYDSEDEGDYVHIDERRVIALNNFGPDHCPNLRQLTVSLYDADVYKFLRGIANRRRWTRKLALSCRVIEWEDELPLPMFYSLQLRMLELELDCYDFDDDADYNPTSRYRDDAQEALDGLVEGENGALEGLTLYLVEDPSAALGFVHINKLIRAMARLHNLSQLAIQEHVVHKRLLKPETLVKVARALAAVTPRLRYIKVYDAHWRVWREGRGGIARLEELEDWEIEGVELFRSCVWEPGAPRYLETDYPC